MSKQIKISDYIFKMLWMETKHRELKFGVTLSYSEIIGLLLGLKLRDIKKAHMANRYKKYNTEETNEKNNNNR